MSWLLGDLKYAFRGMARRRGFTLVAVLSLALGIGANTTIFTLLNGILLRPLAVEDPASLVAVYTTDPKTSGNLRGFLFELQGLPRSQLDFFQFGALRHHRRQFNRHGRSAPLNGPHRER